MLAVGEGHGRRSKHHNPWALEEAEALVEGVAQCGGGKWADIKKLGFPAIESRSAVDLKVRRSTLKYHFICWSDAAYIPIVCPSVGCFKEQQFKGIALL
jgi:hypothetical protein